MRVTDLVTAMYKAGVPDDHVRMVLRATGADVSDDYIPYVQLADALYPAAATAAKRKRMQHLAAEELRAEADAREAWEKMREELLRAAGIDGRIGPAPTLIAVRGSAAPGTTGPMYGAPGTARAPSRSRTASRSTWRRARQLLRGRQRCRRSACRAQPPPLPGWSSRRAVPRLCAR